MLYQKLKFVGLLFQLYINSCGIYLTHRINNGQSKYGL